MNGGSKTKTKYAMAALICLQSKTGLKAMKEIAATAGLYKDENGRFDMVQVITIEDF